MCLDCHLGNAELSGDLFVHKTTNDQLHHLALALTERKQTGTKHTQLSLTAQMRTTAIQRLPD